MFGLGKLLYVIILTVNGIAVLSEDRFLNRIGWGSSTSNNPSQPYSQFSTSMQSEGTSVKTRMINLISAVRTLMRLPLIFINVVVIFYELVLG
ncbi:DEHA2G04048p [Debaryomyces hansenii CBS767]|uniref:DEHA2G04048p n=1 Tax=Debaryomyces hansenii (strain ATCC 36239 / CBS 767 / BCRC 21394 / JCM 1990 / NBRC 0083 / IGC 2968) TaxID=284592 RepID=Q6BJ99_DEBHA|nr:DEHA2G04048p [Debaryomyces hansenii CBS767]CAG90174.2 DEHA2G04048p [Debaryomyces hansenii CBS767]|eukprot:XP_461722.2 DEHA2G04048p [Debaryomyces hansenii CBS767]